MWDWIEVDLMEGVWVTKTMPYQMWKLSGI